MNNQERLVAFISALKNQDQQSITEVIAKTVGGLKEIFRMFRYYKDEHPDKYKGFCDNTKDAIDNVHKVSDYQGAKGYPALWNCFAKPEVIEDIDQWVKGKEQLWDDDNHDFMPNSEALEKLDENGTIGNLPKLSKLLKPDGHIRYMRKGRRCKVHIGDIRKFIEERKPGTDMFSDEVIEAYLDRTKETQEEIRQKKTSSK